VTLHYLDPESGSSAEVEERLYPRSTDQLPPEPKEIKPHPYGVELGMLMRMLQDTPARNLSSALKSDFSRVTDKVVGEVTKIAHLKPTNRPRDLDPAAVERLHKAIQSVKIMAPPTNCLSPIGEQAILAGLYQQIKGEFYTAVTRPPAVYRGNPFVIEAGLAYGKGPEQAQASQAKKDVPLAEGEEAESDTELARVIRYANRVPLLYQQSACVSFKSVLDTTWRNYGIAQSRGAVPAGPMVIFVHMASVWVPFTSESKEAIAEYDEIRKEITLALRECGRRLGAFLRRRERAHSEFRRRNIFELYIEEVVASCNRLKGGKLATAKLKDQLQRMAMKLTGGAKTDDLLGQNGSGPEGLPHSIIVTPDGVEGEVPALVAETAVAVSSANGVAATNGGAPPSGKAAEDAKGVKRRAHKGKTKGRAKAKPAARKRK
jgi:DNA topoisomerase-6 subunit B